MLNISNSGEIFRKENTKTLNATFTRFGLISEQKNCQYL